MSAAEQSAVSWELEQGDSLTVSPMLARALASTDRNEDSFVRKASLRACPLASVARAPQLVCSFKAGRKMLERSISTASRRPPPLDSRVPKKTSCATLAVVTGLLEIRIKNSPSPGNGSLVPSVR